MTRMIVRICGLLIAGLLIAGSCPALDNAPPPPSQIPQIPSTDVGSAPDPVPVEAGDPINVGMGEVYFREPGLSWPCPGMDLGFEIYYRSDTNYNGPMGPGWDHSLNWRLTRIWEVNGRLTPPAPPPPPLANGPAPTYRVAGRYSYGAPIEWPYTMVNGGRLMTWPARVEGSLRAGTNGLSGPRLPLYFGDDIGGAWDNYTFSGSVWNWYWVANGERFYTLTGSDGVYQSVVNGWELREEPNNQYVLSQPGGVKRVFDINGLMQSVSDAWSNSITLTRDSQGNLTEARHSNGRVLAFSNDASGRLVQASGGTQSLNFNYATNGLLSSLVWQGGGQCRTNRYSYGQGLVVTRIPAAGSSVNFTYVWTNDAWNMPVAKAVQTVMGTDGYLTGVKYTDQVSEVTSYARGLQWYNTYYFTNNGGLSLRAGPWITASNKQDRGTAYTYDSAGNMTQSKDFDQGQPFWMTGMGYDDRHQITSLSVGYGVSSLTQVLGMGWDATWQQPAWMADAAGTRVDLQYNRGRISRIQNSGGGLTTTSTVSYESRGLPDQVVNANGHATDFSFDGNGRVQWVKPGAGPSVWAVHDSEGRLTQVGRMGRDASFPPSPFPAPLVSYGRNGFGWITNVTYADGLGESYQYDGMGRLANIVDRGGRETWLGYNQLGIVQSVTRDAGGLAAQVQWLYDQQANGLTVKDELGRAVEGYELDLQGRAVSVTNVEGQVMHIAYSVGSFVKSIIRFDGSIVSNVFDSRGRLSGQTYADDAISWSYTANDLVSRVADSQGAIVAEYDGLKRLTRTVGVTTNSEISYGYFSAGQVSFVTSVLGVVSYTLDAGDRLSSISSPADTFNYSYNTNNGLLADVSAVTSGVSVAYQFDMMDRATNIVWQDASNTVLRSFGYSFNAVGMITQKVTTANGQQSTDIYSYDSLYRLVSETSVGSVTSVVQYSYDLAGNRMQMVQNGETTSYTIGLGNKLSSWGVDGTNSSMEYDAAGNVTSINYNASNQVSLSWDSRYRVTAAYTNGGLAEAYTYDALGRRISTSDGTTTNYLVYDGNQVIAETDASGTPLKSYTYGPGIDNILSMTVYGGTTSTYYYVKDHLGTVAALTDSSGTVVESYQYDAWGNVLGVYDSTGGVIQASSIGNRYLWQGREYSWKTGLYYFRARWYDPVTGRWLSNDPIGISGGLNQYVFCANNPVNFRDPFGLCKTIYEKIRIADRWLREHHPELYKGITPLIAPDIIPEAGLYWGMLGPYSIISINLLMNMDQAEVVETVAHELMHAQLGGAWYNVFLINMDPQVHENIYQQAGAIWVEYNQR